MIIKRYAHTQKEGIPREGNTHLWLSKEGIRRRKYQE